MKATKSSLPISEFGLGRIVFFSDAVMAIAITLLAIDLKIPVTGQILSAGQLQQAILYAGAVACTGFSLIVVWFYASHNRRLVAPHVPAPASTSQA